MFQREDDTTGADGADDDAANAPADPAAAHPTLREGSHGPAVQEMQDKLGQALTAGGPVTTDGRFGPTTSLRVRRFQRARGLTPDGVVGPATWTALEAAAAGVPAPVRPTLSLGATGADVGLAQEKLNASGQAGATLPINALFDAPMQTAVNAFQSTNGLTPPSGAVDVATWAALDSAAPGGGTRLEGGRSVEQHVDAASPATSTAAQVPGTSLHSLVGPGGITSGPAVREFQQKLNAWLAGQGQAAISDDGSWGPNTGAAATAFQGASGVAATGIGDLPTWTALDAVAPNVSVGFENRQWTEEVGGHTYGMTEGAGGNGSRYSWEIAGTQMKVTAAVHFVGGSPPGAWFGYVRDTWNHFDLVEQATGQRLGPTAASGSWPTRTPPTRSPTSSATSSGCATSTSSPPATIEPRPATSRSSATPPGPAARRRPRSRPRSRPPWWPAAARTPSPRSPACARVRSHSRSCRHTRRSRRPPCRPWQAPRRWRRCR